MRKTKRFVSKHAKVTSSPALTRSMNNNWKYYYHSVAVPSHCKYCTCATASCSAGHCSTTLYRPTRSPFHGFPTSQYHTTHPLFLYTTSHHLTIVHHFFTSLHVYCIAKPLFHDTTLYCITQQQFHCTIL